MPSKLTLQNNNCRTKRKFISISYSYTVDLPGIFWVFVMASLSHQSIYHLQRTEYGSHAGCNLFVKTVLKSALCPDRQLQARNSNPPVTLWPVTVVIVN